MDTTLYYLRMCNGAKELQEKWKFEIGDYFSTVGQTTFDESMFSIVDSWYEPTMKKRPDTWVWLLRQDQLQGMLPDTNVYRMFNQIGAFGEQTGYERSPEELTLKYVMKVVYDKTWHCGEWVG